MNVTYNKYPCMHFKPTSSSGGRHQPNFFCYCPTTLSFFDFLNLDFKHDDDDDEILNMMLIS